MAPDRTGSPEGHERHEQWLRFGAVTEVGHDDEPGRGNEDRYFALPEQGVFGVLDGMSRPRGGGEAAETAKAIFMEYLQQLDPEAPIEEVQGLLKQAFDQADRAVVSLRGNWDPPRKIGTTAVVAAIRRVTSGPSLAVVSHVGNSRAYHHQPWGGLEQLTLDDGMVRGLSMDEALARMMQKRLSIATGPEELSDSELLAWNQQNVLTAAVGHGNEPHLAVHEFFPGQRLVLTTDGVHSVATDRQMVAELDAHSDSQQAAEALVRRSKAIVVEHGDRPVFDHAKRMRLSRASDDDRTALVIEKPET